MPGTLKVNATTLNRNPSWGLLKRSQVSGVNVCMSVCVCFLGGVKGLKRDGKWKK